MHALRHKRDFSTIREAVEMINLWGKHTFAKDIVGKIKVKFYDKYVGII